MKFRKIIHALIILAVISALASGVRNFKFFELKRLKDFTIQSAKAVYTSKKVEIFKLYSTCGHLIKQAEDEINLGEQKEIDLGSEYPEDAGWNVVIEGESIKLIQKLEGLCPKDEGVRWLGVQKGFLAIFQGPAYLDGPLLKITDIKVEGLPLEWQEKVYNKTLEFSTEFELLEALDSLDEYQ